MLVKRYHATDMQQAMDTVVKELGSDAVILNSRKVRKKGLKNLFSKPVLEVMVAYDPKTIPVVKKRSTSAVSAGAAAAAYQSHSKTTINLPTQSEGGRTAAQILPMITKGEMGTAGTEDGKRPFATHNEQVDRLDRRIDSIDSMLSDFIEKFSFVKRDITYDYSEEINALLLKMIENQVREELAHQLARETDNMLRKQQGTNASEILEHLILEKFGRPEPLLHKKFTQKVVLVIGPTGVGKTTTIVKLAADFAVKQKKKVGIMNTDTFRIGAQEQLQTYADILDIPLSVIYQHDEIEEALSQMAERDVIFVDTAGKKPGDEQHKQDILELIRILKPEDVMLCLSATTGFSSIKETIDAYSFVEDYKMLVTKLDETKFRGHVLNMSWYAQRPLAYVTTGQSVPDDIEIIDIESITKAIIAQDPTPM